ncbi:TetR/AcrR family transcriptional regulator [Streptomyces hoynatensis]|uniref:TetR/AcrR family transcriptional regulator n=1 Tax=Streptomyces hoynatensis TaxID=1141874 RepID=A0A3A9YUL6_9ACTN|nr:TetR/AcrR family transcriptional regulator [Streptomyces hoynatensis]RKN39224.1 TetR/AcrR family transcriptional regulator [Streptomyces hoynatensis]
MTEEREREVLSTVVDIVRESGYEALTMDAVAARAHCGKATLYRQWHSKPRLVARAISAVGHASGNAPAADTGSLRGDLHARFLSMIDKCREDTPLIAGLAHAALVDRELARAMREALIETEMAELTAMVDRAVARGELTARPAALAHLSQLIFGAVLTRPLFEDAYADADYLVRLLDEVLMPALTHT